MNPKRCNVSWKYIECVTSLQYLNLHFIQSWNVNKVAVWNLSQPDIMMTELFTLPLACHFPPSLEVCKRTYICTEAELWRSIIYYLGFNNYRSWRASNWHFITIMLVIDFEETITFFYHQSKKSCHKLLIS